MGLNSNEEDVEGPVAYVDRKIVVDTYSMDDNHYTSFLEDYYQFCRFYADCVAFHIHLYGLNVPYGELLRYFHNRSHEVAFLV